jgi:hypothetical protein
MHKRIKDKNHVKNMCGGVHSILITPVSVTSQRAMGWTGGVGFLAGARC